MRKPVSITIETNGYKCVIEDFFEDDHNGDRYREGVDFDLTHFGKTIVFETVKTNKNIEDFVLPVLKKLWNK